MQQLRASDHDPIRVLLGPMPDLLREMIEDLLSCEPDMVVLGRSEDAAAALAAACRAPADMLIMQAGEDRKSGMLDAIVEAPPFSIFAISPSGKDARAVNFVHEAIAFDTSSRTAFAAAIRRIARSSPARVSPGEGRWRG
jgi:DNA-binding NarL/FixJ family response regulator